MLTSVQAAHARFTTSPRGGFDLAAVDALRAHVAATLASHEGTGTPGRGGLTAEALSTVVLPSVSTEPGYALLEVQDFIDEAHEALASFEHRAASSQAAAPQHPAVASAYPTGTATQGPWPAPSRPLPRNVTPAIRALAAVGSAPAPDGRRLTAVPASAAPQPVSSWRDEPAPAPAPAPSRPYGMDADALVFELQQAVSRSRARGTLEVSVQIPGQQLRVMRVVETTPGSITIVAQ